MSEIATLKHKVRNLINNSEYRSVKLGGVSCSRSDLEMLEMYCEHYERNGNLNNLIVMENPKKVLQKFNIL